MIHHLISSTFSLSLSCVLLKYVPRHDIYSDKIYLLLPSNLGTCILGQKGVCSAENPGKHEHSRLDKNVCRKCALALYSIPLKKAFILQNHLHVSIKTEISVRVLEEPVWPRISL